MNIRTLLENKENLPWRIDKRVGEIPQVYCFDYDYEKEICTVCSAQVEGYINFSVGDHKETVEYLIRYTEGKRKVHSILIDGLDLFEFADVKSPVFKRLKEIIGEVEIETMVASRTNKK